MKIEKKLSQKIAFGFALLLFGAFQIHAQDSTPEQTKKEKEVKVQRHTVMEQFAREITPTEAQRRQMKLTHLAEIEKLKKALDTMDISRRKKRKILADLVNKPYSDRVNQAMAEISFDDDEVIKD